MSGGYPQDYIRYVGTVVGDAVSGEYLQDYIRYMGTVVGDAMSESIRKTIYDMRGWRGAEYPLARSSTVPGGDTPCLTAGDARRVNPWIGEELPHLRHRRCRTAAASARTRLSLYAFSATPPASESSQSTFPRVPPRFARVSPAVTHGAPPPEAVLCGCESRGGRVGVR